MIRLGMLDFDTSHVVQFAQRLNHTADCPADQRVDGAKIVVGCPGESKLSPERVPGFTAQIKKYGIPLVDRPEEMIGQVDGMLITAVDGSVHWDRARPFLEAGLPCFVDKPFACSLVDARKIVELADRKKAPVFSTSSLRYTPEVTGYVADAKRGKLVGCFAHGPATLHPRNPGLFHYAIHAVEILYTLMGPGCDRVTCTHEKDADVATGVWKDGRVATVRGNRTGPFGYGFVGFAEKGAAAVPVGTKFMYRELLKKVVEFFRTKKPPVDPAVTLEIVAFIEAANASGANHGSVHAVRV